jgi:dUTP pyrophosphatase
MSSFIKVPIKLFEHGQGLPYPFYATERSAGMDVFAALTEPKCLQPGERECIPLGFSLALPENVEAQIRSRSGLAAKHGLCVLNAPGTIDPDYRGELMALMINLGHEPFILERGLRLAQLVVASFCRVEWAPTADLDETHRNTGGFGSTGSL